MAHWIDASTDVPPVHPDEGLFHRVIVYVPDLDEGTIDNNGVLIGWHIYKLQEWRIEGSPSKWDVTHWMPMPQPPIKDRE